VWFILFLKGIYGKITKVYLLLL